MKEIPSYKANPGQRRLNEILRNDEITRLLVISGARSGKTFELIRTLIARSIYAKDSRHAIIRKHFAEAKKFIWLDTFPKVLNICYPKLKSLIIENKSDYFFKLPNGSEIWIGGLDDKERADKILGGEYNTIYFNEISEISYESIVIALTRLAMKNFKKDGKELINKAYFDANPTFKNHWSYKIFYEGIDPVTRLSIINKNNYAKIELKPEDNLENLPGQYIQELKNLTGNSRKRFYEGIYQEAVQGALWNEEMINHFRVIKPPSLKRVVVAIDPAVTSGEQSNETGIVVIGQGSDDQIYVLDDLSGIYSPNQWGSRSILAYDKWRADAIIGEVNQGGDMVESIILNIRDNIGYHAVRATRGKYTRAEPIASLYERGLVHHVGSFPDLEYQMTTYIGDRNEDSPDRLDALVWGITALTARDEIQEETIIYDERVNISSI